VRILLINQVFHPDVAATAQHGYDLARHLTAHGHEVEVIASRSLYGRSGAALPAHEFIEGIEVNRVGRSFFGKAGLVARAADFAVFYLACFLKVMTVRRPDVTICFTTPPFIALIGWWLRVTRGSRFVFWLMDMYPDLMYPVGALREGSVPARILDWVNRATLRAADRVVVLGRCMHRKVLEKGIDPSRVVHIGVWSDTAEIRPVDRQTNPYRQEWKLGDAFVVMYSGNFGIGHDVATMLGSAEALRSDHSIRFAFVGGGKKKAEVEAFVRERDLSTAVLADYQPRAKLDASLSLADVHLVSLLEGLEGCIVPCKLFGAMAAERPTIFIGSPESEIARVLTEHQCGIVVRQGDVAHLSEVIRSLAADRAQARMLGERARRALHLAYDRERACEAWRRLLEAVG